jgi:hypothetical protein
MLFISCSFGADVSPGMWEITLETRVPDEPGFAPPPYTIKQCITEADARDPSRVIAPHANPGATGCDYTNKSYSGNTFTFTMQCAGTFGIQSSGTVTFTSDTMQGNITGTANVTGKTVQTQNKLSARRVGGC